MKATTEVVGGKLRIEFESENLAEQAVFQIVRGVTNAPTMDISRDRVMIGAFFLTISTFLEGTGVVDATGTTNR